MPMFETLDWSVVKCPLEVMQIHKLTSPGEISFGSSSKILSMTVPRPSVTRLVRFSGSNIRVRNTVARGLKWHLKLCRRWMSLNEL